MTIFSSKARLRVLDVLEAGLLWVAVWLLPMALAIAVWFGLAGPGLALILEGAVHSSEGRRILVVLGGGVLVVCWLLPKQFRWQRRIIADRERVAAEAVPAAQPLAGADARQSLERRARHEAAHAVAGTWAGNFIVKVDVQQIGITGGRCESAPPVGSMADSAYALMVLSIAGQVVDTGSGVFDYGAQSDMNKVLEGAAMVLSTGQRPSGYRGELSSDALVAAAREDATEALCRFSGVVEEITSWLTTHPGSVLRGPDLEQLLEPVQAGREGRADAVAAAGTGARGDL